MSTLRAVFFKEVTDGRRDRRALMSAFLFPILAPALVYFMLNAIIDLRNDQDRIELPVAGLSHAPALVQWLRERNVRLIEFEGDMEAAASQVKDQTYKLVLVVHPEFESRLSDFSAAQLTIVSDGSRSDAQSEVTRVRNMLRQYNQEIASLRLIVRGVSPSLMQVLSIEDKDVASKQERTANALNFIPLYIILAAFVSGMGLAVDSTAGERERHTLEPLLLNPVLRFDVVLGKWFAASLFAAFGMLTTMLLCIAAMLQAPLDEIGLRFHISASQILLMFIGMTPLALFATSLQLMLGMLAKSFKDAQSYIGLLTFLPMLPMLYTMFNPVATKAWMYWVPVWGQHLLLVEVLSNNVVPMLAYFASAGSCLLLGALVAMFTARLMERESILTG